MSNNMIEGKVFLHSTNKVRKLCCEIFALWKGFLFDNIIKNYVSYLCIKSQS